MLALDRELEEMKSLTQLVLYGWGYPRLFNHPITNNPFQNRLVRFSLHEAPSIEGISPSEFRKIRHQLVLIQENYRDFLARKQSESKNPYVFISVDAPNLSQIQEQHIVRKQFEDWAKTNPIHSHHEIWQTNAHLGVEFFEQLKSHWFTIGLRQMAIAIVVLVAITLTIISVLAVPAVGCSGNDADGFQVIHNGSGKPCFESEPLPLPVSQIDDYPTFSTDCGSIDC